MLDKDKHIGHIILECLRQRPDAICQIDAATGKEETNASVLRRSIQLARCLRRLGFVPGDVLALSGRNHLDQQIPYLAGVMNGLPLCGIDAIFKIDEIKDIFKITKPKVAFCEPESYEDYVRASKDLDLDTRVFTYGEGEHSMMELTETYRDDTPIEKFEAATFDKDKVYMWLVSSGGTSGVLKLAAVKHDAFLKKMADMLASMFKTTDRQQYIPVSALMSPSLASGILKSAKPCDLSCFQTIVVTGGKVFSDVLLGLKKMLNKNALLIEAYGQTENLGPVFVPNLKGPIGSCGRPYHSVQTKLVDPETGKEITEPNVTGEMWTKSFGFSCYYNNPEETAAAFTEDGWFKTGDLLYHDEDNNYFFVERLKMLIKYKNYHIIPPELEGVIRSHEGVFDVSVTSIPHEEDGEHPVACVVRRPGATVTAQEIKDLVANKLSNPKQLRGGVVFLDQLPLTHARKVARGNLRKLVMNTHRE